MTFLRFISVCIPLLLSAWCSTAFNIADSIPLHSNLSDTVRARLLIESGTAHYKSAPDSASALWLEALALTDKAALGSDSLTVNIMELKGEALNNLGIVAERAGRNDEALDYYQASLKYRRLTGNPEGLLTTLGNLGVFYRKQGNAEIALKYYRECLQLAIKTGDQDRERNLLINLAVLYQNLEFQDTAEEYYRMALTAATGNVPAEDLSRIYNGLGGLKQLSGNPDSALIYYRAAWSLRKDLNDPMSQAVIYFNLADVFTDLHRTDSAEYYFNLCLLTRENAGDKTGMSKTLTLGARIARESGQIEKAIKLGQKALELANASAQAHDIKASSRQLYEAFRAAGRTEESLKMLEISLSAAESIEKNESDRLLIREKFRMDYEKLHVRDSLEFAKQQEIQQLRIDKVESRLSRGRIILGSALAMLFLLGLLAFLIRTGKRKSEKLLLNILPAEVARELRNTGRAVAKRYESVTVIFTDFKAFTSISSHLRPEELVAAVDHYFSQFDRITEAHGVEKIKTIGDAYMAVSGLPVANPDHALNAALAAIEMMTYVLHEAETRKLAGHVHFELRIGMHSGPVVAGVVGLRKFQYDVWGDTVNVAARIEGASDSGRILVSEATKNLLGDRFRWEPAGTSDLKGKGPVTTFYLLV